VVRSTGSSPSLTSGSVPGVRPGNDVSLYDARVRSRLTAVLVVALGLPRPVQAQSVDTTFDSNGVPIHYVASGSGEPVVLIHGFSADLSMWDSVRVRLASDHRVIAMDCRGHGRSGKPHEPGAYGIEMVNDVTRLLDHLERHGRLGRDLWCVDASIIRATRAAAGAKKKSGPTARAGRAPGGATARAA